VCVFVDIQLRLSLPRITQAPRASLEHPHEHLAQRRSGEEVWKPTVAQHPGTQDPNGRFEVLPAMGIFNSCVQHTAQKNVVQVPGQPRS
jgi:hypothetical protein